MNRKAFLFTLLFALALLLVATLESATAQGPSPRQPNAAMGTAFTYQGQLKKNGSPVNTTCDFQFGLYANSTVGPQVGTTQVVNGVQVTNGVFMVSLNSGNEFGAIAFNGDARWLEVYVKCSGDPVYYTLSPRQQLTPAPYALALPGLYTQSNSTSPNLIGGYNGNNVTSGVLGATISGGGAYGNINSVTDNYGTVGGGYNNLAGDDFGVTNDRPFATVSGGSGNHASGSYAVVGGGSGNAATGSFATVGGGTGNNAININALVSGGYGNVASGQSTAICGGLSNAASGDFAAVGGGAYNTAAGLYSFAAGRRAKANDNGSFVWGDSTDADVTTTFSDEFVIRASNGVRLTVNAGASKPITFGRYFRDNAVVAWASVWNTGAIDQEFGVNTITRLGTGRYQIDLDAGATTGGSLIPLASAEVDAAPTSANAARIVTINQIGEYRFEVYINDGNWNLVDNDFVFIVTGR